MKCRIRKYSPLWWLKECWLFILVLTLFAAMGISDVPAPAEEAPEEAKRIITYVPAEEPEPVLLGEFTVTAYCPCEICCGEWSNLDKPTTASGEPAVEGITVGADWGTIPVGTVIELEGIGERVVQDKPAGWIIDKYDGMIIDLYFDNHQDAWDFGKKVVNVWEVPQ